MEQAADFQRLVRLLEEQPDLADAIRYLEDEPGMYGFYKTGEAILRAIGRPKKWKKLVELGWTSDEELRCFTQSTHMKRHHGHAGSEKIMTVHDAEAYIRRLLSKLVTHLDNTT